MTVNRRIVSILTALIMMLAMMPVMTETAHADDTMTWSDLKTALEDGGTVTMTNDITRDSDNYITIYYDTTLDLNGFTLDGAGETYRYQQLFEISKPNGRLTIKDSSQEKKGTVQNVLGNSLIYVNGQLVLESGTIKGMVYVLNQGIFAMSGGSIITDDEGVAISDGYFDMKGGKISGCDKGVYAVGSDSSFTMTGGAITGCKTGVFSEDASYCDLSVGGDAKVTGNERNVYVNDGLLIHFVSSLSEDALIGISSEKELNAREFIQFTDGFADMGSPENFFSDDDYDVVLQNNELRLEGLEEWGTKVDNNGIKNYVRDDGTTSTRVKDKPMIWLKEESGGESSWYGVDNSSGEFKIGSRFWVRWLDPVSDKELYDEYYSKLDEEHKKAVHNGKIRIFLSGAAFGDDINYYDFESEIDGFIQVPGDWTDNDITVVYIDDYDDEVFNTDVVNGYTLPDGVESCVANVKLKHFSPFAIYCKSAADPDYPPSLKKNPLRIKARTATVKYRKLKRRSQTLKASQVIKTIKKGKGKMSYKYVSAKKGKKSFKKYFKINKKNGRVTVKKGLKKGTYNVTVKVRAAGNKEYLNSSWKKVTFKIRVK